MREVELAAQPHPAAHRNEVILVGRLAAPAQPRVLPSGDELVTFRLVVSRPKGAARRVARPHAPSVDTIDCVAWRADVRHRVAGWDPDDTVEIVGSLRRRFWRGTSGLGSRSEVEATRARRIGRASAP